MPPEATQAVLRQSFTAWGRPLRTRVDNGGPWGSKGDLPTDLGLWQRGLAVEAVCNPPRCPTANGVVERSQGVSDNWAEPWTCASPEELQGRLAEMDRLQREEYPRDGGRSRMALFPGLPHSGRPYDADWEQKGWDLSAALQGLASYRVPRRVDGKGQVSVYNRNYYVGQQHRGRVIYAAVDPVAVAWLFTDAEGRQLACRPAGQLTRERIRSLRVTLRR